MAHPHRGVPLSDADTCRHLEGSPGNDAEWEKPTPRGDGTDLGNGVVAARICGRGKVEDASISIKRVLVPYPDCGSGERNLQL